MKLTISAFIIINAILTSTISLGQSANSIRQITILYTNDEHGWMEGMYPGQGAANLYQLWQDNEGYSAEGNFLLLSGGDNFTGPAISTWVEGESMVEVMNAMHYDAAAVGNHEFDFGLQTLQQRAEDANYPYLSANIRWRESAEDTSNIGIFPFTLKQLNDIEIGIIGLTTTSTPYVTNPDYVSDLNFIDYELALRSTLTEMNQAKLYPDLLFIISHVCLDELELLLSKIADLNIALAGGGHCNELVAKKIGDTVVLGGGFHFSAYAKASFTFDMEQNRIIATTFTTKRNRGASASKAIQSIVSKWQESASDSLKEVIAFNGSRIKREEGLNQLIINSWLKAYPEADIAINNKGGVRADLAAGEITLSDLVNILPFDNNIISVEVTGRVIVNALNQGGRPVVAGMEKRNQRWILSKTGEALQLQKSYKLLLNSFMYAGGNNFGAIEKANPNGVDIGMNYRQPFYQWLKNLQSSRNNPYQYQ